MTTPAPTKLTLDPDEVAPLLGIGRNSVYRLLKTGELHSVRVGRKILIPRDAVSEFLAGRNKS